MCAEAIPEKQASDDRGRAEEPKLPGGRSIAEHVARVADSVEASDSDVGAIGNQAEAGEKAKEVAFASPKGDGETPNRERQERADEWSRPHDDEWMRIDREIGSRNDRRIEND